MERTLAILKPDTVAKGHVGDVLAVIEAAGFRIRAMKLLHLTREQAATFYAVHHGKGFWDSLLGFMTEGPCVPLVLEREDAIAHWREVLLPIREQFGADPTHNAVHGSDAPETAAFEIGYLFAGTELV